MTRVNLRKKGIRRYVHSGGFNKLAGHPTAPGSMHSEYDSRCWKAGLLLAAAALALPGILAWIF